MVGGRSFAPHGDRDVYWEKIEEGSCGMDTTVLVGDLSVLDRYQIREAVIRIPEVGIRIREVQTLLDEWCPKPVDLAAALHHDDITFGRMGNIRGVLVAAVQLGLYDRYVRRNGKPNILIGPQGTMPLLRVFAGNLSLRDVLHRIFDETATGPSMIMPSTRGNYDIVKLSTVAGEFQFMDVVANSQEELVQQLVEQLNVGKIVNIGPGSQALQMHQVDPIYERLQVIESIENDPMLSWFWTGRLLAS